MIEDKVWFSIASSAEEGRRMNENVNPRHRSVVTQDMKHTAKALRLALEPFVEMRHTVPAAYIIAFLRVVEDEGNSVSEYAREAETSKTVMTRYLLDLGERDRHGDEGFKLITQQLDLEDRRVHRAYVTPKGGTVMNKAKRALELFAATLK